MATLENLTIMFTDIVGFSDLLEKLPRAESEKLLERHDKILTRVIRRFAGKTIKSIGDSFLVIFRSPTDAVICGMAIHDALWEENQKNEHLPPIHIRVALNTGEVRLTNHDVYGDAVNIASRVEQITPTGSVYLSEAVFLSMSKSEVILDKIGRFEFKGVSNEVNVYQANYKPLNTPSDEHQVSNEINYPYGGAHIHHKARHHSLSATTKGSIAILVLACCVSITWWAATTDLFIQHESTISPSHHDASSQKPPAFNDKINVEYRESLTPNPPAQHVDILSEAFIVTSQLKFKTLPLLNTNNYLALESIITDHMKVYPNNAFLRLIAGHTDMYFKRYKSALNNYQLAFAQDATLATNSIAVNNLIELLEYERKPANKLIAKYLNTVSIQKLGLRTGQAGLRGRYDAFHLLKDSGNKQAIDLVGLNIWDLKELDKCQMKKTAVIELKRLKSTRALDALKESINVGFIGQFKYFCLFKDAKEAIKIIEGKKTSKDK